jgi:hypothetical protein
MRRLQTASRGLASSARRRHHAGSSRAQRGRGLSMAAPRMPGNIVPRPVSSHPSTPRADMPSLRARSSGRRASTPATIVISSSSSDDSDEEDDSNNVNVSRQESDNSDTENRDESPPPSRRHRRPQTARRSTPFY